MHRYQALVECFDTKLWNIVRKYMAHSALAQRLIVGRACFSVWLNLRTKRCWTKDLHGCERLAETVVHSHQTLVSIAHERSKVEHMWPKLTQHKTWKQLQRSPTSFKQIAPAPLHCHDGLLIPVVFVEYTGCIHRAASQGHRSFIWRERVPRPGRSRVLLVQWLPWSPHHKLARPAIRMGQGPPS